MATMALPGTSGLCRRYTDTWCTTGTKCCAAAAGKVRFGGKYSNESRSGVRSCDQSCIFPIGSYRLSLCCESMAEERSAVNLHATFCGSREWATAPGNPVEQETEPSQTGLRWRGESPVEYPPGDYSHCACSRLYSLKRP